MSRNNTCFKTGHIPWNKGIERSEETKRKISLANKGQTPWNKGLKGSIPWNKGKKSVYSAETLKRMSESMIGKKIINRKKPIPFSDDRKRKMSLAMMNSQKVRRGNSHPCWKGGATPILKLFRNDPKYKLWRTEIFKRDDYTCLVCLSRGGNLQVDHIKPYSVIFTENNIKNIIDFRNCLELWDLKNGRTICYDCHRKTNTWGVNLMWSLYREVEGGAVCGNFTIKNNQPIPPANATSTK